MQWLTEKPLTTGVDLHTRNFLFRSSIPASGSIAELHSRYGRPDEVAVRRADGNPPGPHAPPHAIYPMSQTVPADEVSDPEVVICDHGTSFVASATESPTLHTPALYLPPEDFFGEAITTAADIWTLGATLYEVLRERPLFESFEWDRDDIIAEMFSTLGPLPARWWDAWWNSGHFSKPNGERIPEAESMRTMTPYARPLRRRLWDMGRGETPESCKWDFQGGEFQALEDLLRGMLAFEPAERLMAEQVHSSEYIRKWALPAWERQVGRAKATAGL
ncbi:Uu.00g145640.m01.CDS01 [Anthostomella pinea]|uniref:Uu.00g145640.m01.CDS01 n=1 Tax=Anthostomella pinea TaxID=933095 RepID=A0AAI8VRZ1_9PEZI|nr:Uu.00g145640.m01.CDS01 [Anthostomella pinea]